MFLFGISKYIVKICVCVDGDVRKWNEAGTDLSGGGTGASAGKGRRAEGSAHGAGTAATGEQTGGGRRIEARKHSNNTHEYPWQHPRQHIHEHMNCQIMYTNEM